MMSRIPPIFWISGRYSRSGDSAAERVRPSSVNTVPKPTTNATALGRAREPVGIRPRLAPGLDGRAATGRRPDPR